MISQDRRPRICCLDLDTFFVSVERTLDPSLEGQPVIIGGRPGERGVVTACSYEVRRTGVRSGMSLTEAVKLAPNAIYLPTRHTIYAPYAAKVRQIAARFSPEIRVASIDEMYMSFAGCERLYRKGPTEPGDETIGRVVREMTDTIRNELGLPASAGIATSKAMAKVASGLAKPAGVVLVPAGREAEVLAPLPVRKLPGIGPVSETKLAAAGLSTLGDVARAPLAQLRLIFGAWAESIQATARGQGLDQLGRERPAFQEFDTDGATMGSISNERTFRQDVRDPTVVTSMLCALSERVCWRTRKRGVKARTVTLKLRYSDFHTITRSKTVPPTDSDHVVYQVVRRLFDHARTRPLRIRLLGVALSNLEIEKQLSLLPTSRALHEAVDGIRARFGYESVGLALGGAARRR